MKHPIKTYQLTILRTANARHLSVKVFNSKTHKPRLDFGSRYTVRTGTFTDLHSLAKLIEELDDRETVIHGTRNDNPTEYGLINRRYLPSNKDDMLPSINEDKSFTLTFDLDNTEVPVGCHWGDIETMAGVVWQRMGEWYPILKDVGCVWSTSGSAAVRRPDLAKFHFTVITEGLFKHDRQHILKNVVTNADEALHNPVQPHFFSGRICKGFTDPLAGQRRVGVIEGGVLKYTPTPEPVQEEVAPARTTDRTSTKGLQLLDFVCKKIRETPEGGRKEGDRRGRHLMVRASAYRIGMYVGGGEIAKDDAVNYLKAAVQAFNDPAHHEELIDEFLAKGEENPRAIKKQDFTFNVPLTGKATLDDARQQLDDVFTKRLPEWLDAPKKQRLLVRIAPGVGKTTTMKKRVGRLAVSAVSAWNAIRSKGQSKTPPPIVIAVERVSDAYRTRDEIRELNGGLNVEVMVGRENFNSDGKPICDRTETLKKVERAGVDLPKFCGGKKDEDKKRTGQCPFFETCEYQRNRRAAKDAHILIITQAYLTMSPKHTGLSKTRGVSLLIVDEDPTGAMSNKAEVTVDPNAPQFAALEQRAAFTALDRHIRESLTRRLALTDEFYNEVAKVKWLPNDEGSFDETPLLREMMKAAADRLDPPDIAGSMTDEEIEQYLKELNSADDNDHELKIYSKLRRLMQALNDATLKRDTLSKQYAPGIRVGVGKDGKSVVTFPENANLNDYWKAVPTVVLSATADPDLLALFWGDKKPWDVLDVQPAWQPNFKTRQAFDTSFSKSSLVGQDKNDDVMRYIWHRIWQLGIEPHECVVIAQKEVLIKLGLLKVVKDDVFQATKIRVMNFNGLTGDNRGLDAKLFIQAGRILPKSDDIERAVEHAMGRTVRLITGHYWRNLEAGINYRGLGHGPKIPNGHVYHPEPLVNKMLQSLTVGQSIQGIGGRPRGVIGRDYDVHVDILGDVPIHIPIDEYGSFADFMPTVKEMLAAEGVALNPSDRGAYGVIRSILPKVFGSDDTLARKLQEDDARELEAEKATLLRPMDGLTVDVVPNGGRYSVTLQTDKKATSEAIEWASSRGMTVLRVNGDVGSVLGGVTCYLEGVGGDTLRGMLKSRGVRDVMGVVRGLSENVHYRVIRKQRTKAGNYKTLIEVL